MVNKQLTEGYKKTEVGIIPIDWQVKSFKEVFESIKSGISRRFLTEDIGYPVIRSSNINGHHLDLRGLKYWYYEDDKGADLKKLVLKDGDILVNFINSTSQIGKCCIFIGQEREYIYTTNIFRIKAEETQLLAKYFYFYSQTKNYETAIEGIVKPAVNQASFTKSDFEKLLLPIPSIKEQEKITTILISVDNAIEKIKAIIEQTEKVKKGLMQQLLTKGIGHTKFKKTEIGMIPEEWVIKSFDDILTHIGSGITPRGGRQIYLNSGIPFIRSQNVYPQGLVLDDVAYISDEIHEQMKRSKVLEGDVLLNITGASIGRCTYLPKGFGEANVNQHVCILRPNKSQICTEYLSYFISSYHGQKQISNEQSGQTREGLNYQQIRKLIIPLPTIGEQCNIVNILRTFDNKYRVEENKLTQLQTLRIGLMQVLLTGKVRVKVDKEEVTIS